MQGTCTTIHVIVWRALYEHVSHLRSSSLELAGLLRRTTGRLCQLRHCMHTTAFRRNSNSRNPAFSVLTTRWPSGPRRCVKAAVLIGVGSNPTLIVQLLVQQQAVLVLHVTQHKRRNSSSSSRANCSKPTTADPFSHLFKG
jgi:hypothetical protein